MCVCVLCTLLRLYGCFAIILRQIFVILQLFLVNHHKLFVFVRVIIQSNKVALCASTISKLTALDMLFVFGVIAFDGHKWNAQLEFVDRPVA